MGLVYAELTLFNAMDTALHRKQRISENEVRKMEVNALVDSGAYMLAIPEKVRLQLGLDIVGYELAELANGTQERVGISEPIEVHFQNRRATVDALITGNEVLLGAIPMEAMDVIIHPKLQKLVVNPEHPNTPVFKL